MKQKTKNLLLVCLMAFAMLFSLFAITPLTVFANEPEAEITEVTTFNELLNAVNSDKTHIKLMNDIKNIVPDDELPTKHRLVFDGGKDYILDLNGNMLMVGNYANEFYTDNFSMIAVSNSSNLEIENGSIVFENWYTDYRTAKGVAFVTDDSILTATDVDMYNGYTGTVVYATDDAKVTLDGGDYTAMSGFAVYLEGQSALTVDGGVWIGTKVGDSMSTVYLDGYGALYSESTGEMVVNNAYFNTGIQIHESQVSAFSTATHELVINGIKQEEDIHFSDAGNQFSAMEANKDYYWYKNGYSRALYKIENPLFANAVSVISYEKKYSIDVQSGTATVGGNTTTEVGYGQTVTIVADSAESGMEFVRWDTSGVELADYYSASTTFTMPAAPVYIAAYYGKESVKSVSVTAGDITVGDKAYNTEITLDSGVKLEKVEWYESLIKMEENDVFKPGKAYELKILVYPPDEHKFGDTVTATVNGKQATVNADSGYAIINYTFDALAGNPFPVIYNTSTSKLGIGGLLELDTALMSSQSNEFKTAFDADTVTYQWYKDGEIIEGATDTVYNFTADDVGCRFFVSVTVSDKTAWGDTHTCHNYLYQVYLNASDFAIGGKAPQISSATPGVSINPKSLFICEGKDQPALDIQKTVLIPGKTYIIIGTLVQTGEANIPYEANVYVNDILMDDKVDGSCRFFYKFTVPGETDYPVYYKTNGAVGIGVTLTVDVEKMCNESGTFNHAVEAANPTYQTVFYQWYKNGEAIEGATDISYTVKSTDRDSYINCKVTLVDGKCGIGEQQIITNVITVLNVKMSMPKNGESRIKDGISADGATVSNIMWIHKDTEHTMQGDDKYVEGDVYEYLVVFEVNDTFNFDYQGDTPADMTVAYIYGEKIENSGSGAGVMYYYGEVTAIHTHQYSDTVWNFDGEGHWQPCIVPGCPNPNENYEGYVFHWGGNATCHTAGTCGQCGAEYYAEHDFSVPDYQYVDEMKCATYCANCDEIGSWSYHTGGVSDCQNKSVCEICHHEYGEFAPCAGGTATCTEKAKCATCGNEYGELIPHEYSIENGYKGADGHANACSCGAHETPVAHDPDRSEATETDSIKCTVCGYIITPATGHVNHTPKAEWTADADSHWHECTGCEGQQLEKAAHSGGVATCTARAVCTGCGNEYGELAPHEYTIENGYKGADGHANTCSCGAHETPIAHNPDRLEATETEPIKCTVCGYIITPATGHINHIPKAEWENDANNHWHECTGCEGQQLEKAAHSDENANGKCDVCDADVPVLPPVHNHDYGTAWESDANGHWNECACGDKANEAAHNDGDADGKCDVCDYDMPTTPGGETPEQPENPEQPEQPENPETPEETKGLSGGAIAGIVVGSVAVVGIGGFALVWFVIKKKTWAELIAIFKKK